MRPRRLLVRTTATQPGTTGRSHSRPGFSFETTAARNTAAAGDRRLPSTSPQPPAVGRRTFFACLAALGGFGAVHGAREARERFRASERHAEPWSGPLTFETVTVTVVPQHAENSSDGVSEAREEQRTVAFGETGAKGVREIRGVNRIT